MSEWREALKKQRVVEVATAFQKFDSA